MIFVFLAANKSYNKSISVFKKQLDSSLQNIIAKKSRARNPAKSVPDYDDLTRVSKGVNHAGNLASTSKQQT